MGNYALSCGLRALVPEREHEAHGVIRHVPLSIAKPFNNIVWLHLLLLLLFIRGLVSITLLLYLICFVVYSMLQYINFTSIKRRAVPL